MTQYQLRIALLGAVFSMAAAASELEEVLVTAQKRTEGLRTVPLSLTVIPGESLRQQGIFDFSDLASRTPNLSANDGSNSFYIRGIGSPELNLVGDQAVSYIVDGLYLPKPAYLYAGFLDIKQIEILKGPQGTLFGRNSAAGVIKLDHGRPSAEWTADFRLRRGNRDMEAAEGVVSGPVTERLALRLAANRRTEEGSTRSVPSGDTLGDRIREMQRATLQYVHSENFDATLRYTRFKYFDGLFLGHEFHAYPDDLRAVLAEPNDPYFEANLNRRSSLPRNKGSRYEPRTFGKGRIIPLEFNWRLWGHQFTAISGYAEVDTFLGGDADYLAVDIVGDESFIDHRQYSQELRVARNLGRWSYTAGAYYFRNTTSVYYEIPIFQDFITGGLILEQIPLETIPLLSGGQDNAVIDNLLVDFDIDIKAYGFFGEISYAINDRLKIRLGGRSSREDKTARISVVNTGPVPVWLAISDAPYSVTRDLEDRNFSPKLSLIWESTEDLTLYAAYAESFRAPSFNAAATEKRFLTFKGEESASFELGMKSTLLGNRLHWNLSVYDAEFRDYQLSAFTGVGYVKSNVPKVKMRGVETDITAILMPGLRLATAIAYNDAYFADHRNGACPSLSITQQLANDPTADPFSARGDCDLTGRRLHRAPQWSGHIGVDYRSAMNRVGLPWTFLAGATAVYKDEEYFDADLDPIDSESAYWIYDAYIGVSGRDERWSLTVHGKNLGNELRKTFSGDVTLQPGAHIASANHPRFVYAALRFRY